MTAYHRRPWLYPEDAYAMAVVKLGSGSNLLGYYMYHGGTNPEGRGWLNEMQRTPATNYNDLPVKTYDFQAPIGEFGQRNPHYYLLRKLHLFMRDWGESLAMMEPSFPCPQDIAKGDDSHLRWAYRSRGDSGFVFINNYERLQKLSDKRLVTPGLPFPSITIPAGTTCIFPYNIDGIRYATAQLIAKRDGRIYMEQIAGIPTTIALKDGKVLRNVKPKGQDNPVYKNICLLTPEEAGRVFLEGRGFLEGSGKRGEVREYSEASSSADAADGNAAAANRSNHNSSSLIPHFSFKKLRDAGKARTITIGVNKVAEEPTDEDFAEAAVYRIPIGEERGLMRIDYRGDVARLYAGGKLVADNFYNGRPFFMGLWRL